MSAGGANAASKALISTARQLLDATLFSSEHIGPLQELALSALAPSADGVQQQEHVDPGADAAEKETAKASEKLHRHSKYAALMPEVRCRACCWLQPKPYT
jgi:hypothetical protein